MSVAGFLGLFSSGAVLCTARAGDPAIITYTLDALSALHSPYLDLNKPPQLDSKPVNPLRLTIKFDTRTGVWDEDYSGTFRVRDQVIGPLFLSYFRFGDPRTEGGDLVLDIGDADLGGFFFDLTGPALYSTIGGKTTYRTGRFALGGDFSSVWVDHTVGQQLSVGIPMTGVTLTTEPLPEPSLFALFGAGAVVLSAALTFSKAKRARLESRH